MESIQETTEKIKGKKSFLAPFLVVLLVFATVAGISFILGRLSLKVENQGHDGVRIEYPPLLSAYKVPTNPQKTHTGQYVASIGGTKYYTLDCGGVSRIKEENKTYFTSISEAENAGYEPASSCF